MEMPRAEQRNMMMIHSQASNAVSTMTMLFPINRVGATSRNWKFDTPWTNSHRSKYPPPNRETGKSATC